MDVYEKISFVPVLFLTAKAQESDKLIGFMTGGDDYLMKPFSYSELLSCVKALVRRYRVYRGKEDTAQDNIYIEHSGIRIHGEFNEVYVQGEEISLTDIEYCIIRLMMKNTGRIFSVQMLYEQGRITADEKKTHAQKNVIFPVLGNASEEPQPCITEIIGGVQRGDIIIICSDGLSDYITQGEFEEILALPMRLPRRIAKLAEAAIKNGSPDNVSVVGVSMV